MAFFDFIGDIFGGGGGGGAQYTPFNLEQALAQAPGLAARANIDYLRAIGGPTTEELLGLEERISPGRFRGRQAFGEAVLAPFSAGASPFALPREIQEEILRNVVANNLGSGLNVFSQAAQLAAPRQLGLGQLALFQQRLGNLAQLQGLTPSATEFNPFIGQAASTALTPAGVTAGLAAQNEAANARAAEEAARRQSSRFNLFNTFARGAGGALGGFLTGGPTGAAIGGGLGLLGVPGGGGFASIFGGGGGFGGLGDLFRNIGGPQFGIGSRGLPQFTDFSSFRIPADFSNFS